MFVEIRLQKNKYRARRARQRQVKKQDREAGGSSFASVNDYSTSASEAEQ